MIKVLKFLKPHSLNGYGCYNSSDVAGFEEKIANDLIKKGIATIYKPPIEKVVEEPEPQKPKLTLNDLEKSGSYYVFPDGEKVNGKKNAYKKLNEINKAAD